MPYRVHIASTLRRVAATFILSIAIARALEAGEPGSAPQPPSRMPETTGTLPPWTAGYLYIHHISTGRGNSAYIVMPDGTTLLIDAGETDQEFIKSVAPLEPFPPRPNA